MNIYVKGSKRSAISRMFPVWEYGGHSIVDNQNNADVQLAVINISKKTIPTVLRLDGIYYDKADNYNNRNASISRAHSIADAVVYQSNLSKKMCEKYLNKRKTTIFDVIYNGIGGYFENFKEHDNINIVSCSKWRRPKRLPEIIEVFDIFLKSYSNAKLHIIGETLKGASKIKHKNVTYHGHMLFDDIKRLYTICDIYLHLCKKDSCPSSVIEAVAAGIPVITTNACGGAYEMCQLTKGCIIVNGEEESLESDYIYKDRYNQLPGKVCKELIKAMLLVAENKQRAILPKELQIEVVAEKYIEIMRKII